MPDSEYQYAALEWTSPLVAILLVWAALFVLSILVMALFRRPSGSEPKHKRKGKHE